MAKPRTRPVSAATRNAAYRARMRAQGLRQAQIWVPDLKKAELLEEIHSDVEAINRARFDDDEKEVVRFLEAAYDWPEP